MVIHAVVSNTEVFEVEATVRAVLADRDTRQARSEQEFRERAALVVRAGRPDPTDGFVRLVTEKAWSTHLDAPVRLELNRAALALLAEHVETLPSGPGTQRLRTQIEAAAARVGWQSAP